MIKHTKILYTKTPIYTKSKTTAINSLSSKKRHNFLACPHFSVALHTSFSYKWIRTKDSYHPYSKFKIFRRRQRQHCFCRNYGLNPKILLSLKTSISRTYKKPFRQDLLLQRQLLLLVKVETNHFFCLPDLIQHWRRNSQLTNCPPKMSFSTKRRKRHFLKVSFDATDFPYAMTS